MERARVIAYADRGDRLLRHSCGWTAVVHLTALAVILQIPDHAPLRSFHVPPKPPTRTVEVVVITPAEEPPPEPTPPPLERTVAEAPTPPLTPIPRRPAPPILEPAPTRPPVAVAAAPIARTRTRPRTRPRRTRRRPRVTPPRPAPEPAAAPAPTAPITSPAEDAPPIPAVAEGEPSTGEGSGDPEGTGSEPTAAPGEPQEGVAQASATVEQPAEGVDRGALMRTYASLVGRTLGRRLRYPRAAERAGLEGTVVLSVVVDAAGAVVSTVVFESSGHAALDRAAIRLVEQVGRLPAPPTELRWARRSLRIPIRYTLGNRS